MGHIVGSDPPILRVEVVGWVLTLGIVKGAHLSLFFPQAGETRARVQHILNGRKIKWWASSGNPSISDAD